MLEPIEHFRMAIAAAGMEPPGHVVADGAIHRFSSNGTPGDDAGWYALHTDGIAAGAFGCWRTGLQSTWCARAETAMTRSEQLAHKTIVAAMKAARELEASQRHDAARVQAAALIKSAKPATTHAYLTRKGVQPHGVLTDGANLLVPMRDTAGTLHSLQTITPGGDKRFLPGGKVAGCYFGIGKPKDKTLLVCEGFATGASLHKATGHAVAVAFNAGNLGKVAAALRQKFPAFKIIIAADDDVATSGNPGMTQAQAAANAIGGWLAVPDFGTDRPSGATDFNDLHQITHADAVKRCVDNAVRCNAASDWPVPTPLPSALPPVQAFDAELLPQALRDWVTDIAHRMQCPIDFPAVAAVVAISSLIGTRAVIQPKAKDDWQVVPNLWGLIVGRPGVKKSPALSEVLKPLHRLQANEAELHAAAHAAWQLDGRIATMRAENNEKKAKGLANAKPDEARALLQPTDAPPEPVPRRFVANDATVEKLGELMSQNPWGLLSYRDELYGLLTGLDKQGQEGARAFMLQSYDGNQGYTFDRIGRGVVQIPRVCQTVIGGIQPGRIQEYVRSAVAGGSADDGLLQRFGLAVWPDCAGQYVHVDQWPDSTAKQTAYGVFDRLAQLQPANDTDAVVWKFSPEAQSTFVLWLTALETELRGDDLHPAMVSHLAKYRKLIPALALVFALIDTPDSGGVVNEQELLRALAWGDYLRTHAVRLYAAASTPETSGAQTLIDRIEAGKLTDSDGVLLTAFSPRQIAVKGWTGLDTPDAVRKAAGVLVDFDWLRKELLPTGAAGGRPSEVYQVNPTMLQGGSL